jgi:hypothetical protein
MTGTGPSVSSSATKLASSNNNGERIGVGVGVGVGATCVIVAAIVVYMVLRRSKGGKGHVGTVQSGDTQAKFSLNVSPNVELDTGVHEIFEAGSESHHRPYYGNVVYHEVHA